MESWLMAVDSVGKHVRSWRYIQGSTRNHENEWKTNNLWWMLYSVYAALGECCIRWMVYSVYAVLGVCCTRCQLMIMAWRDSEGWLNLVFRDDGRVVDEKESDGHFDENDEEDTSGCEKSWVWLAWLGCNDLVMVLLHSGLGPIPAWSGMIHSLAQATLLSPSLSWWFVASPLISPFLVRNATVT